MRDTYYIKIQIDESNNASSKAVNDCNKILEECGIIPFRLKIKKQGNKYVKKINNYLQVKKIGRISRNAILFVPHPIYLNKMYIDILKEVKQKKNIKLVFLIHDLESLRKMFPDAVEGFEYIDNTMYDIADYIISHNERMTEYLASKGVEKDKIFNLQIFDYLIDSNLDNKKIEYSKTLNIAGNLDTNKCKYIKELNELDKSININLYGLNFDENVLDSKSIHYKGAFPADEIPQQLSVGFGLVWDGESANGCTGNTGEYLMYNNPHKLSLYLVSGLPVVIWSKAAEAKFVKENKVGIVVDSIGQFNEMFDTINEEEYYEMVENANKISDKLRHGKYLENIIREILYR